MTCVPDRLSLLWKNELISGISCGFFGKMLVRHWYKVRSVEMVLASLVLPAAAFGQEFPAAESEAPASPDMEEVIVYGQASLGFLRSAVFEAEDNYFAAFNELNSTDDFDISCRREEPPGTRIAQRVCRARFVADLEHKAFREGVPFATFTPLMLQKAELLQNEMRELLVDHPELLNALSEFDSVKASYESEREERCAGRKLFCRR